MHDVFHSTKNSNDKRTLHIKIKNVTTDADELFDTLIQHHKDLSKKMILFQKVLNQ